MMFKLKFPLYTAVVRGEDDMDTQVCVDGGATFVVDYVFSDAKNNVDMVQIKGSLEDRKIWNAQLSFAAFCFISVAIQTEGATLVGHEEPKKEEHKKEGAK